MGAQYDVRISKEASGDILAIHHYIEQRSPQNATRMVERLFRTIEALEHLPHRYKIFRKGNKTRGPVRSMPVPPFIVYYRVVESDRVVRILTVRHGARRQPRTFE